MLKFGFQEISVDFENDLLKNFLWKIIIKFPSPQKKYVSKIPASHHQSLSQFTFIDTQMLRAMLVNGIK